ncbi:hypothetical protein D3C81_1257340 [compost metagenome]
MAHSGVDMACASYRAAGAPAQPVRPYFVKPIWNPLCFSTVAMAWPARPKRAAVRRQRLPRGYSAPDKGDENRIGSLSSNQVSRTFADHVLRFLGTTKFRTLSQCATRRTQEAARQPAATVKRTGARSLRCRQISGLKDRGVTAPICRRKSEIRSRAWSSKVSCPDGADRSGLLR